MKKLAFVFCIFDLNWWVKLDSFGFYKIKNSSYTRVIQLYLFLSTEKREHSWQKFFISGVILTPLNSSRLSQPINASFFYWLNRNTSYLNRWKMCYSVFFFSFFSFPSLEIMILVQPMVVCTTSRTYDDGKVDEDDDDDWSVLARSNVIFSSFFFFLLLLLRVRVIDLLLRALTTEFNALLSVSLKHKRGQ